MDPGLAEATADLGDLAKRFDAHIEHANESWVLDPPEVASALASAPDQVQYLLETAARSEIGLLISERYFRCEKCGNLMPIDEVQAALEDGDGANCTQCDEDMSGHEPVDTVYRLAAEAADEARARGARPERTVVILTALELELRAVHAYLAAPERHVHDGGTVYYVGPFEAEHAVWRVATASVGSGNPGAAAEAERAIAHFHPELALFVGVAGGIKDVELGDVVAATEVFLFHAGKALDEFQPRPEVFRSAYALVQQASAAAFEGHWLERIRDGRGQPKAIVEPIAAGEQVVASVASASYHLIREHYDRAVAVEMEGAGFLRAAYANQAVQCIVVRGISDMLADKAESDGEGWQPAAASHAAAFAFELLAMLQ